MPKIDIVNAKNIIESNPEKAFFKLKNTGGPKGDTGAQGPQGPKGDQGEPGAPGASASVTVGSTTTLSPGADATVTNSGDTRNAILNFGIPTGARGPQGVQGPKGDTGPMGQTGAKGDTGAAATVQVGNTNTGAPGTNAQVTNAGNEHFAVFNFTIPRGDKGEKGATGAQGQKGDKGDKGDTGTAATITVGSTTTTNPGTSATVTNSGSTSAAVLNFGIPRGATGSVKSEVVSELPETGEEDTFYLVNREATEQTATGKAISFMNSDNSGDITDFQLDGETSQNGTPTPSAPVAVNTTTGENVVKITGKNLADINSNLKSSSNGLVFTANSDGSFTMAGTTTSTWANITNDFNINLPAGEYTFSIDAALTHRIYLHCVLEDGSSVDWVINAGYTSVSRTFTSGIKTIRLDVSQMTNGQAYNETIKVQLEKGSSASSFESYQGQSYEVNLGKNLFDPALAVHPTGMPNNLGETLRVDTNTTYTFNVGNDRNFAQVQLFDNTGTRTRMLGNGPNDHTLTFTTTSSEVSGLFCFYPGQAGIDPTTYDYTGVQLEKGSQATSYAAYFAPIELCKIGAYQDSIYKSGGKWYVRKAIGKVILDGSESWSLQNSCFTISLINCIATGDYSWNNKVLVASDYYQAQGTSYRGSVQDGKVAKAIDSGSVRQIAFKNTSITSVDGWKTWLGSNNTTLYYVLATPTDTEITNQALIAQLEALLNNARTYAGVNNIFTITPNEQGTLEIKYVTYDKYNQNKVYIWNDTLQQWQIIVQ